MSEIQMAEQLWVRAHELIKTGNLAQSVRDLAKCYELLKAAQDPRLPQVHRRWIEVHQLYLARAQQAAGATPHHAAAASPQVVSAAGSAAGSAAAASPAATAGGGTEASPSPEAASASPRAAATIPAAADPRPAAVTTGDGDTRRKDIPSTLPADASSANTRIAGAVARAAEAASAVPMASAPIEVVTRTPLQAEMSLEEAAEAAVNEGELSRAIALYQHIVQASPTNELAEERLGELQEALARVNAHRGATASQDEAQSPQVAGSAGGPRPPFGAAEQVAYLEGLLQQVQERRRSA